MPKPRDTVKRELFIPEAVLNRRKYESADPFRRKLEKDIEAEEGGPGVYSIDMRSKSFMRFVVSPLIVTVSSQRIGYSLILHGKMTPFLRLWTGRTLLISLILILPLNSRLWKGRKKGSRLKAFMLVTEAWYVVYGFCSYDAKTITD
jgi:hypothetical protein